MALQREVKKPTTPKVKKPTIKAGEGGPPLSYTGGAYPGYTPAGGYGVTGLPPAAYSMPGGSTVNPTNLAAVRAIMSNPTLGAGGVRIYPTTNIPDVRGTAVADPGTILYKWQSEAAGMGSGRGQDLATVPDLPINTTSTGPSGPGTDYWSLQKKPHTLSYNRTTAEGGRPVMAGPGATYSGPGGPVWTNALDYASGARPGHYVSPVGATVPPWEVDYPDKPPGVEVPEPPPLLYLTPGGGGGGGPGGWGGGWGGGGYNQASQLLGLYNWRIGL